MGAECCKATGSVGSLNLYTDFAGDSDLKASISQATSLLRKAQTIKQTLQTCRDKSEKITTIPLRDPLTFIQNAQVLQWALSASHHGNIQQAGFSISAVSPFLDIKSIPLNSESYELLECLQIYIDTVTTQANTMKQIVEDLYGLKSELNKWKQSRESQNDKEGTKATSYKKLVQEMRAITNLEESLREAKAKLPWMIEKVQSLIITADEVGFQADREGISNMRDITARFRISLDSGQEKKKWVMRTSNAEGVIKPRDSNVQRIDKGKGVRESSQPIENRENAKQYQSVSFGANFSSLRSNSRNMDNISPFQSTKDCFVGEKARMPLASLKIAELDKNNPKLKESSVTFRVRASDLENNGKIIQLGSKHNPFTIGSTDISNANGSLNGVCDLKEKSHGKSGSCSLIKEKLSLLDMDKLASMLDENLIDDDNLSISIVQDSARKHISKAQW